MPKPIIIANWKMAINLSQQLNLASQFSKVISPDYLKLVDVVVCPSSVALFPISSVLPKAMMMGGQNIFWQSLGSYTGEISAGMLKEVGCDFCIIGHSERKENFGETDSIINKKISACLDVGLSPILCIGESWEQRGQNQSSQIIFYQLTSALSGINLTTEDKLVIAYEPIWSIGSGQLPDSDDLLDILNTIEQTLSDLYPASILKNNIRLVYGGSINKQTVVNFSDIDNLSGFLVGGASLEVNSFTEIIKSVKLKGA